LPNAPREIAENLTRERRDLRGPLSQRWEKNREHVETVEEVLAKRPHGYRTFEIPMGGGNDSHVYSKGPITSDALEVPGLENSKKLHLCAERQLRDLVEEQGPVVCALEYTDVFARRTGECSTFMAEEQLESIQLYIDPDECICCAACVSACPVEAIFDEDDVPKGSHGSIEANAAFFRLRRAK
jgi:NAD-dependent dihydropyrimidine dehydrogenase PreA subunit